MLRLERRVHGVGLRALLKRRQSIVVIGEHVRPAEGLEEARLPEQAHSRVQR